MLQQQSSRAASLLPDEGDRSALEVDKLPAAAVVPSSVTHNLPVCLVGWNLNTKDAFHPRHDYDLEIRPFYIPCKTEFCLEH